MSLQTNDGFLNGSEETKTGGEIGEFNLRNDDNDAHSCSNGGTPSVHDLYESC